MYFMGKRHAQTSDAPYQNCRLLNNIVQLVGWIRYLWMRHDIDQVLPRRSRQVTNNYLSQSVVRVAVRTFNAFKNGALVMILISRGLLQNSFRRSRRSPKNFSLFLHSIRSKEFSKLKMKCPRKVAAIVFLEILSTFVGVCAHPSISD